MCSTWEFCHAKLGFLLLASYIYGNSLGRGAQQEPTQLRWESVWIVIQGFWIEPTVRNYFSSSNIRLLACVFTGEDPQSE